MTEQPKFASQVEKDTELTEDDLRRQRARQTVQAIQTRREAVRRSGGEVASSSAGLAGSLEMSLKRREKAVQRSKAKRLAREAVAAKRGGDAA